MVDNNSDGGAPPEKKIQPYPISIKMKSETLSMQGKILKLVEHGFLVEVATPMKAGSRFEYQFTLPASYRLIQGIGVVIKAYDQYRGELGNKIYRIAEIHFVNLNDDYRNQIAAFLRAIRQTD